MQSKAVCITRKLKIPQETKMDWKVETRKRGAEIWAEGQCEAIFVGDGYEKKEHKRSMELANVIVKALNDHENKLGTIP